MAKRKKRRPVAAGNLVLLQTRVKPFVRDGVDALAAEQSMTAAGYTRKVITDHVVVVTKQRGGP